MKSRRLPVTTDRPTTLDVCAKRCAECLFSENRIVSAERAKAVIDGALRRDTWFECHRGSLKGRRLVCRGFYDAHARDTRGLRMAVALGIVRFVPVPPKA